MKQVLITDEIQYLREDLYYEPEEITSSLISFIYDIPYFSACGVFPNFHIINHIFATGSSGGGMSPGATWTPFAIDEKTYAELSQQVRKTAPNKLASRYTDFKFVEDHSFDAITDWMEWMQKACEQYRDSYQKHIKEENSP